MNPNPRALESANGTVEDAASFFRVSIRTVWRWVKERRLSYWHEGRNLVFGEEAIIDFRLANFVTARGVTTGQAREIIRREWRGHLLLRQSVQREKEAA